MAAGVGAFAAREAMAKYEEPKYSVISQFDNIEIRQYPPVISAEVEVAGNRDKAANEAFRILAGYIFGKNISRVKIAMTVPVIEETRSEKIAMTVPVTSVIHDGKMIMRFYMPSEYNLDTLPEANDSRIKFAKLPAARYAVIKFSGFAGEDKMAKYESKLRSYLAEKSISSQGLAIRAFYNPPWTLPFLRRNEVWLQIDS